MTGERSDYTRHHAAFIECDFCGSLTRGRIYKVEPEIVRCGACHRAIQTINPSQDEQKPGGE
jgi:hypothetical protein